MHLLDPGPKIICELGGEGSISHPCGVGLHNSIDVTNHPTQGKVMCLKDIQCLFSLWGDAKASADPTDAAVGRGDIGVGAEVDIQHGGVGPFHQDLLALSKLLVEVGDRFYNQRPNSLS